MLGDNPELRKTLEQAARVAEENEKTMISKESAEDQFYQTVDSVKPSVEEYKAAAGEHANTVLARPDWVPGMEWVDNTGLVARPAMHFMPPGKPIQPIQGNGEIHVSEANVRAAIEHWLNSQVLRAPITVTGVTYHPSLKTYAITFKG